MLFTINLNNDCHVESVTDTLKIEVMNLQAIIRFITKDF